MRPKDLSSNKDKLEIIFSELRIDKGRALEFSDSSARASAQSHRDSINLPSL